MRRSCVCAGIVFQTLPGSSCVRPIDSWQVSSTSGWMNWLMTRLFAVAVSRDGRTWKWTTLPRPPAVDNLRFFSDGSRIVREARKDHQVVESLVTVNGETWAARPKTSPWFAERAISGRPEKFFQVMVKAGDQPAIVSEASSYWSPSTTAR